MKYSKFILGLTAALAFTACEKNELAQPEAAMSTEKYLYEINETMEIHFTGTADNVVIYTGDTDHDYELREQSNYGLVVNKGLFTYAYQQPGTYKVVCVATNHADAGQTLLRDTCSFTVQVVDDNTEIYKLSASILYDEVFATAVNESDWLLGVPTKMRYNGKDMKIKLNGQKLKFYIHSDSAKVYVDDVEYSSNTKYDLSNTLNVRVKSHAGTERNYKLYTLNYPEFATYEAAGVTGTVNRNEYDYSYYEVNLTVPAGTDLTAVTPTFTFTGTNEKAYIDEVEQTSGSTVDLSQPVTYTLKGVSAENPEIEIESTFVVTATFE